MFESKIIVITVKCLDEDLKNTIMLFEYQFLICIYVTAYIHINYYYILHYICLVKASLNVNDIIFFVFLRIII